MDDAQSGILTIHVNNNTIIKWIKENYFLISNLVSTQWNLTFPKIAI